MARQPHERRAHQKGQHDADQAGDDGRGEEAELEAGYPARADRADRLALAAAESESTPET